MTSFLALREVLVAKADFFAQRAMARHRQSDSGLEKKQDTNQEAEEQAFPKVYSEGQIT